MHYGRAPIAAGHLSDWATKKLQKMWYINSRGLPRIWYFTKKMANWLFYSYFKDIDILSFFVFYFIETYA